MHHHYPDEKKLLLAEMDAWEPPKEKRSTVYVKTIAASLVLGAFVLFIIYLY